ncbi:hemogen [Limosa lapponica baueri]|uniref:Hemogen n=1 Tax=Limosa lapponica baueri TaxID=1758121 RepID=A0A2I0UNE4_LIMLA|nr:hemogen [Limosa lapponica baueri]
MDWIMITAGASAKQPWGKRESPPLHAQLLMPVKSPSREQTKRQRRGRGARRGRGRQPVVEINLEPEPELDPQPDPQPDPQEEAEPVPSKSAAPSEPVHQEQPPMLTFQDVVSGMQPGVVERELAARSQDPAGELPESQLPHGGSGDSAVLPHEDCHPRLPTLSTTGLQHNYSMGPYPTKPDLGSCERGGGMLDADTALQATGSDKQPLLSVESLA